MYLTARSLDDLLRKTFTKLLRSKQRVDATRGSNVEIAGAILRLTNPRARLSRTETRGLLFSCLGEFLWYMTGDNTLEFIEYYLRKYREESDDGETIWGGYGRRLMSMRGIPQLPNVIKLLRDRPSTRRAVVQIFSAEDLVGEHRDIPCTCALQFLIRNGHLHVFANMRSNDAYKGLPHDIFSFTMLQEVVARHLDVKLGPYYHTVNSLHLYDGDLRNAEDYLEEGWQLDRPMPPMPNGDPFPQLETLLRLESELRHDPHHDIAAYNLPQYWADLGRLLKVFALSKVPDLRTVSVLRKQMHSTVYEENIRRKHSAIMSRGSQQEGQLGFPRLQ